MALNAPAGMRRWVAWSRTARGALVAHPLALGALALLIVNDHLLKHLAPGFITGKASDVAGLIVAPLMIVGALELVGVSRLANRARMAAAACLAVATLFAAVKTIPAATDAFSNSLGLLQWLIGAGFVGGQAPLATLVITDPSDLLALPAVFVAFGAAVAGPSVATAQRRLPVLSLA